MFSLISLKKLPKNPRLVSDRCKTAPLCNRVRVEIPPRLQFPPFPHKQRVPRLGPCCGGGAAFDPGFGFFDFVSTGPAAPTTCKSSTCSYYL